MNASAGGRGPNDSPPPEQLPPKTPARPGAASRLRVNGIDHAISLDRDRSLLYVLREELGLTGTKYRLR